MQDLLEAYHNTAAEYRRRLAALPDDRLTTVPNGESWSPGQVFVHILIAANNLFVAKTARAAAVEPDATKTRNELGDNVYKHNSFPPILIPMPDEYALTPPQPGSKADILEAFDVLDDNMRELADTLTNSDAGGRSRHPILGYLNAREWYMMVDIHNRHHLRQLDRLTQGSTSA